MPRPEPTPQATRTADAATAPSISTPLPTTRVLGVDIARVDYAQALDRIDTMVETRTRGYVCVAPVHLVMLATEDRDLQPTPIALDATRNGSHLVLP